MQNAVRIFPDPFAVFDGLVTGLCVLAILIEKRRSDLALFRDGNIAVAVCDILADERLRDMMDVKVFVEADADERILRRVLRDVKERGRDIQNIVDQYLDTVKPMHYLYVEPTKMYADIVINSGMNDVALDVMKTKISSLLDENK